jgi:basic membrane lipoprotein Med (substrate-binding protein (PBP1-ABC) superfamily)
MTPEAEMTPRYFPYGQKFLMNFPARHARLRRAGAKAPASQGIVRVRAALKEDNQQGVDQMKRIVLGLMAATAMTFSAYAQDIKPGLLFDLGGKFDKSFNESSYNGAEKFKKETGIEYREYEIKGEEEREQALRRFAEDGNNPIVMAGFSWSTALTGIAKDFPDTKFTIIDGGADGANVRSVVFKEQEGSYLVGILGAMASKSKKVGFVGGMNIPLIRRSAAAMSAAQNRRARPTCSRT